MHVFSCTRVCVVLCAQVTCRPPVEAWQRTQHNDAMAALVQRLVQRRLMLVPHCVHRQCARSKEELSVDVQVLVPLAFAFVPPS